MEDGGEEDAVFWAQEKKGRMGWKGEKRKKERKEVVLVYSDNVKMGGFPKEAPPKKSTE